MDRLADRLLNFNVRGAIAALAVVVVIAIVVILASSGGAAATPPATAAASVVPANALAYIHVSSDESRSEVTRALKLAAGFPDYPLLRATLVARLGSAGSSVLENFRSGVRPWLGKEVALAIFDTSSSPANSLLIVGVRDRAAARRFVGRLPSHGSESYQGATITGHPGAADTALVGPWLLVGHSGPIRAAIDVARGHGLSLSHDLLYQRAAQGEPAGRVLDAYFSSAGLRRLLASQHSVEGIAGALVDQPALQGLALSLTPADGGIKVHLHSALDPQLAPRNTSAFKPSLGGSVPSGAALYLDVTGLNRILPRVLRTIGIGAQIPALLTRLGHALSAEGVNVHRDLLSLFERESAVVITSHGSTPVVTVVTRPRDMPATRTAFAQLEAPLERLFAPAGAQAGQAPLFNQVSIGRVAAHQLVLAPGLQFDYAISGDELLLSTSLQGIEGVVQHTKSILGQSGYQTALGNHPALVTSLLFLDLDQLLGLNDQIGLVTGTRFQLLKPDLERIHAIGLDSTSGPAQSTADLFLQIP